MFRFLCTFGCNACCSGNVVSINDRFSSSITVHTSKSSLDNLEYDYHDGPIKYDYSRLEVRKKLIGESIVLCFETALQCNSEQSFKRSYRDLFNLPHLKESQYLSEQIFINLEMRARNM